MKYGFPICNIERTERPAYYDALSYADVGLYEVLINMILDRSQNLFTEYQRIRTENKRMAEWARKWGTQGQNVLLKRESTEMQLWQSRIRQIILEFQQAADLLYDSLGDVVIMDP